MSERMRPRVVLETKAGLLRADYVEVGRVTVDMGEPKFEWKQIPLARAMDTLHLKLALGPLQDPVGLSMGNPHAVFFVPEADAIELATLGPKLERDPLFPERANIGVAQVLNRAQIRLRVWERGAGLTLACGTGACAALVAAVRRELTERHAILVLDGGTLEIEWRADNHVMMTGPVATSFTGVLSGAT
jgi:diaminopimelate epimerase